MKFSIEKENLVSTTKLRPTELQINKDLQTPALADIKTNIYIQTDKIGRMDTFGGLEMI